jgi:Ferredoxin
VVIQMNVSVTFEPSGISGLVAQGTYLIDAAKRMGAPLGVGCTRGKGECPACAIEVKSGANLLSSPTNLEAKLLGASGLADSLRLACQTKIEGQGEIVLTVTSYRPKETVPPIDLSADIEKKFGELSLNQKIAALLKFEAITMSQAFDAALQKPLAVGTRAFDSLLARARASKANTGTKQSDTPNR